MDQTKRKGGVLRALSYFILLALTVAGVWAMVESFSKGHIVSNTTQHVPWGLWVVFYIYFIGLSAGSFLLSTLVYVFGVKRFEPSGRMALVQAFGCMLIAGWLIFLDLGHPTRMYKVLTSLNPTSVLAWMGLFYTLYLAIIALEMYFAMKPDFHERKTGFELSPQAVEKDKRWLFILGLIGIPVAIMVHGGVGSIFAVAKARPNWFSGLFPIVFLVSALASGGGLLTFLTAATSRLPTEEKKNLVQGLARLTVAFVCLDLLLLASEILVTFYGNLPHEVIGWQLTLFGPYWWVFWFIQLGVGAVIPAVILLGRQTGRSIGWLGLAGLAVVIGIMGTRLNIVIPPQIQPVFDALPEAYHHERFAYGYFPSANEWGVALGSLAIGIWLFLWAKRVLPLEEA